MSPVPPATSSEPHPRPGRQPVEHRVLPQPVDAEAHRVVHHVVARGDGGEDPVDPSAPSPPRGRSRSRNGWWARRGSSSGIGRPSGQPAALLISRAAGDNRGPLRARRAQLPELPEVETVRRGLAPVMEGRRILAADVRRPDLRWPLPDAHGRAAGRARVGPARPALEIPARRARPRRDADRPPRHVRPVAGLRRRRSAASTTSCRPPRSTTMSSSTWRAAPGSPSTMPAASARWTSGPPRRSAASAAGRPRPGAARQRLRRRASRRRGWRAASRR